MSLVAGAAAFRRALAAARPPPSLREFCERTLGLTISPIMAAIMDAASGVPVTTVDDRTSERIFGCARDGLPTVRPREVGILAGGRAGKTSRFAAPMAIYCALYTPTPTLRRGEFARALCMAPDKDLARQIIDYCRGYIAENRDICRMLATPPPLDDKDEIDETKIGALERIALRRPNGQLVEIAVKAAGRGGVGARSRTLVCALLDEASFFRAKGTGVVNDQEIYRAAIQRVVPDGWLLLGSTAWVENQGVLEEKLRDNWGKHDTALVARAGTRDLNPTWDPDGRIERSMRKNDPENAAREIDAQPLVAGADTFYPEDAIAKSFTRTDYHRATDDEARIEVLPPAPHLAHTAGGDMGFRKNSSAIAISRVEGGRARLAFRLELRPERGTSLKPSEVTREMAFWCMRYGAPAIVGDLHYADATREELGKLERALKHPEKADEEQRAWVDRVKADPFARAAKAPVYIEQSTDQKTTADLHTEMRRRMQEGLVELPVDDRMKEQARGTKKRPTPGGHIQIILPKHGMAHGDLWGSTVIACALPTLESRREGRPLVLGRRAMVDGGGV